MYSDGKAPYSSVIRNSITCEDIPPQFKDKLIATEHFARFGKISTITLHPTVPSCTVVYENTLGALLALEQGGTFKDVKFRMRLTERERDDEGGTTTAGTSGGLFSSVAYNGEKIIGNRLGPPLESVADSWMGKQEIYPMLAGGSKTVETVETVDRRILKARNDFYRLATRPAHTAEKRYQVLQAKDHYIRLCLERASDTREVKHIKGTCPYMCPEKECYLRQWQGMVPSYERHSDTRNVILIDHEKAIKQYPRGNTDVEPPLPHELRTEQALGRTMYFLLANVVTELDTDKGVAVVERYNYIVDRTRAIRRDIVQQDLCSQTAVTLVEQCARFHIHCAARLVVQESALFDQQFNTENLKDCLQTLKRMYVVMEQRGESCSGEAEFRAYLLLLLLNEEGISLELQQMSSTLVKTPEVQFALSVHAALTQRNYVRFFGLVRATNYMNACIMHRYFTQVRTNALLLMPKASSRRVTMRCELAQFTRTFCFEDDKDAQGFLEYYGVNVNRESGMVVLQPSFELYQPAIPYWNGPAIRMVAYKRICSVGQMICGEPLDRWEAQFPFAEFVSSFDARARLRKQILEEILGTEEPVSMPPHTWKSVKRIERTKIFDAVIQDTFAYDGQRTTKPAEFHQRPWNFSRQKQQPTKGSDTVNRKNEPWRSQLDYAPTQKRDQKQHNQLAEIKRVPSGEPIEVINLVDSDSDEFVQEIPKKNENIIGVVDKLSDKVYPEKVPQENNQHANPEYLKTAEEDEMQHLQETKSDGVKGSDDATPVDLFESISDDEVWDLLEQSDETNRKCIGNDVCSDPSSNRATMEFQDQARDANRNHLGQGKDESETIQLEENNSEILQSPVEMKQTGDPSLAELPHGSTSVAIQEVHQQSEQSEQNDRKCLEKDEGVKKQLQDRKVTGEECYDIHDAFSSETSWEFQAKHAIRNQLAKEKTEPEAMQLQQIDSTILQSPVEMIQTDDATVADLHDDSSNTAIQQQSEDDDMPCAAMEELKLAGEYLQEEKLGVVERPREDGFDDLLDSTSSNVQLKIPLEIDWNNHDMEKKQHVKNDRVDDACLHDSSSSNDCQEIAEDRECASRINFQNECELLQEHNSVAIEQRNDAKLPEAAFASRLHLEMEKTNDESELLKEYNRFVMELEDCAKISNATSGRDSELPQECGGFVMKRSNDVTDDDLHEPGSTRVDIQLGQKLNERENRPNVEEEEDTLMQPKERRLSVSEESTDVTCMLDDVEGSTDANETIQESQAQNEPDYRNLFQKQEEETLSQEHRRSIMERSFEVELMPNDVQGLISMHDDIQEIQQQRECDNQVIYLEKEDEDEIQQSHAGRCSVMEYASDPSTVDEHSDSSSNCSDSQEDYEKDELQEHDQSSNESEWTSDASTDDEDDSSSITEQSSDASLHYFASVSSSSLEQTECEIREEEETPEDIMLQQLMPAPMYRACKATLDHLLESISGEAMQEIVENEVAWHRLIELYSDEMLSELVVDVIDESARAELEKLEQVRRRQHLLAYKYWHRWVHTVRIAARFHVLLRSVPPTIFNTHPSRCQRLLCEAFGKHELIDPFAVLDHAIQSDVHLSSAPFYWKLVISLCSTDTNDTFESFNTFVDCWLRNSAFKRDPDYEQPGHGYLFYAARALPAEAAICMRLIGDGSAGYETVIERSNGLLFIMHNYEPIAQVRERLRRLLANVNIPPPAIAILHFCPSRCNPVNVGKELELDKETARWKVFRWRDKADNDPLRAATIFLAGCYRDQLRNAFEDPERLEMCSLFTFLDQSVGTAMWFRLTQACCTEAAVTKDGTLSELARDVNEIVRRFNEALGRVRHMVTRQEISSFVRIAEEFDPLRARRKDRAIDGVFEALFPPDWHSVERRRQIAQLLDGLQLHAPSDRLLAAIDRATGEKLEKGRVLESAELRVALDYYLSEYAVLLTGNSCQRQNLVKELAQEVVTQLNGSNFPEQTACRVLAKVSDNLMRRTFIAKKLPIEVCYRRGELRRYLRTVWGIQQYVSQAWAAERSTSTTTQSPSVGGSLAALGTAATYALYTSTPNQKRQATTPISSLGTFAAKRTMKENSGSF
uniref:SAC3/GANP/THP3 conserved domain-containing protein n=1 Tax=Anopheles atroparvus TaxID=41427 RepID=A0A182J353_ANOAO